MKDSVAWFFMALAFFLLSVNLGCSHITPRQQMTVAGTSDVNKDGKPDVTYYKDGEYISKIEADTNYDGKPDVTVHIKGGKFESAEVDEDYNGTVDERFNDVKDFNKWLNSHHPDFNNKLNKPDWRVNLANF
ncbi:MAG: hypothetical protein WC469_01925 [Candidatus Omnitrophota bacterium]